MHSADHAVASCPSIRLSHADILLKWLNISVNSFHRPYSHHPSFPVPTGMAVIQRGPPVRASNAGGMKTSSSAVAERLHDALCPSVVNIKKIITRADSFIIIT